MDFGIIASKMLRPDVEMIFGESKSGAALKAEERKETEGIWRKKPVHISAFARSRMISTTRIRISSRSYTRQESKSSCCALLLGNGLFRVVAFPR